MVYDTEATGRRTSTLEFLPEQPWFLRWGDLDSSEYRCFTRKLNESLHCVIGGSGSRMDLVRFMESYRYREGVNWTPESRRSRSDGLQAGLGVAIRYALKTLIPDAVKPWEAESGEPADAGQETKQVDASTSCLLVRAATLDWTQDESSIKRFAYAIHCAGTSPEDVSHSDLCVHVLDAIRWYGWRPSAGIATDPS